MNGPAEIIFRFVSSAFVPIMLLFPLLFVLLIPTRVAEPTAREQARSRQLRLAIFTFMGIATWGGLALIAHETGSSIFDQFVRQIWLLFFPLWFGMAMPAVLAKNPAWGDGRKGESSTYSPIRTASLVPRTHENPIRTWHRALMGSLVAATFAAIACRGAFAFGPEGTAAEAARERWALLTAVYGIIAITTALVVPYSIARSRFEPEPLDPHGSEELSAMYRGDRRARSQIIFWMLGVIQPFAIGWIFAVIVWSPAANGRAMGIIGAALGIAMGLAGSIFGIASAIRRVRINEKRVQLEAVSKTR